MPEPYPDPPDVDIENPNNFNPLPRIFTVDGTIKNCAPNEPIVGHIYQPNVTTIEGSNASTAEERWVISFEVPGGNSGESLGQWFVLVAKADDPDVNDERDYNIEDRPE